MKAYLATTAAVLLLACGTQPVIPLAGGNEVMPKVVHLVEPGYPYQARKAGVEGMVTVQVVVGVDGAVREWTILKSSGSSLLDSAALEAARVSTFEPGTRGGDPVEMKVTVPFRFRLGAGPKDRRGQVPGDRFWTDGQACRGTGGIGKGRGRDEREV